MTLEYDVNKNAATIDEKGDSNFNYAEDSADFTIEKYVEGKFEAEEKEKMFKDFTSDETEEVNEWTRISNGILPEMDTDERESMTKLRPGKDKHLDEIDLRSLLEGDFMDDLAEKTGEVRLVSGSKYEGTWDSVGMAGVGRYTMPCGAVYEGEFRDGMFHGHGSLHWPGGQRIDGVWLRGELQAKRYTFADGLVFREDDWDYCKFPDRRFQECIHNGLRPAGRTLKTNRQPTKFIPNWCYDTGSGVFDPKLDAITSYDSGKVIGVPSKTEKQWIREHCRKGWMEPTGYQPLLQENWSKNPPKLPYSLPFSRDSPESWWKRLTSFERDTSVTIDERKPSEAEEKGSFSKNIICNDFPESEGEGVWDYFETVCMASKSSEDIAAAENFEKNAVKEQEECEESMQELIYEDDEKMTMDKENAGEINS